MLCLCFYGAFAVLILQDILQFCLNITITTDQKAKEKMIIVGDNQLTCI